MTCAVALYVKKHSSCSKYHCRSIGVVAATISFVITSISKSMEIVATIGSDRNDHSYISSDTGIRGSEA